MRRKLSCEIVRGHCPPGLFDSRTGTKYEKNPDVEDIGILFMVTRTGIEPI